ncbi:nucleotide-binding universal stress UspA family protein [Bradyrhizobium japonicum]|uniref:universal stress protein n=1 Tax=Bradyrhizobium TaxID=374 RepID=UPI0003FF2B61|nr:MULTISPECIES: universal stress protein [Bradyrhizobium]MBR0878494.1 universal stress protein [Bradyrhizobium liaoningense]MBR0944338.1 universal stress protein [Bradyrhizobium liaoningense]MBR0998449.1 universal stress protein [Bradyrhizobium liaoningense]MBR1064368.1 universal stress protein [Bradyrhizobium liaoningense]MCP1739306.1 nucleotide-binding universal stress UspA family protein [Bradyrhizobium japonicum]
MTYATVMVSLTLDQSNEARLQVAGELAERFEAAMIGVAAAQFAPPLYFTDGAEAQSLIDQEEASIRKRLADLEAQFRAVTKARGGRVEWRGAMDFPARFVLAQARCADIIVSGGHSPAFSDAFALASPKDLVMQSGRPLLVVPDEVNWLDLRSVLVAWKDTPEARRAVVDALPMLRKARDVTIVEIPERDDDRSAVMAGVTDVAAWLARHGVTASARVSEAVRNATAAAQLEQVAGDLGAGLIVAGAYGHSRFRELILGGVTEYLVTQSARSVLLSH